jgi:Uma2 family endonuclease
MSDMTALTWDDLRLLPEENGKRHELIDGEHYVTATPNLGHQRIVGNLYFLIRSYLQARPIGEVFGVPVDVIISKFDVVEPDLQYISNARAPELLSGNWVTGAPDLIVEIASKSTRKRDNTIKYKFYERINVLEYWTIDPETEVVRVHRKAGKRFGPAVELSLDRGDVLTTPLFPDLQLRLADIFKQ